MHKWVKKEEKDTVSEQMDQHLSEILYGEIVIVDTGT